MLSALCLPFSPVPEMSINIRKFQKHARLHFRIWLLALLLFRFQSVCNTCKSLDIVIGGYMQGPRLSNYNNNSAKSPMSGNMSQDVKQRPRKYKKITDPDGLGSEAWLNFQLDVNAIMACLP